MSMEPVEQFFGRIVDMVRASEGSPLTAAAGIADTVLYVHDVTDFDAELGGQVQINGDLYEYDVVDADANTVTITTGLLAAADEDDLVEIVDPELGEVVVEYVANVLLDEQDPGDEPIEVPVQHGLVNMLRESIRGGVAEAVTLLRDGPDDFLIFQLGGKLAVDVALEELQGGYAGSLQDIYDRADQAAQDAYDAATQATIAQEAANGKNTVTYSPDGPGATANTAGDIWFQKDVATQTIIGQWEGLGGDSWSPKTLSNEVIANLDAGKLTAGSAFTNALSVKTNLTLGDADTNGVIQSYDFANQSVGVYFDKFGIVAKGGSIAGATITGGVVQTASSGNRVALRNSGGAGFVEGWSGLAGHTIHPAGLQMSSIAGSIETILTSGELNSGSNPAELRLRSSGPSLPVAEVYTSDRLTVENDVFLGGPLGNDTVEIMGSATIHGDTWSSRVFISNAATTSSSPNVYIGSPNGQLQQVVSSSARYKENIADLDLDVSLIRAIRARKFTYKPDYYADPTEVFWGAIAEEIEGLGLPKFVDHDEDGLPENVRYANLVIGVLALAQDNANRIDAQDARLDALEGVAS